MSCFIHVPIFHVCSNLFSGENKPGVARVNELTHMSLGYPLSGFNEKSTLKKRAMGRPKFNKLMIN